MNQALRWMALLLVQALVALPALAVDLDGSIKGVITDTSGFEIPRVEVTVRSPSLQGGKTTLTDDLGRYRFPTLPPGDYELEASKGGFQTWSSPVIRLAVASTLQVDIELFADDEAALEIVVVDQRPAVDVESVATGATLEADFLANLPSGRDYQSAMAVAPGVVGSGNANMHGGFGTSNQFYINGVNVTDPVTNTFSTNLNYDAIESIQVLTGGMDAEYGRSLGGAVNIITKSGGNEFEGIANLIVQTPGMNIGPRDEDIDGPKNLEVREQTQQLALNLGGPIVKDKVWFFTSFQGDRFITQTPIDTSEINRDLDRFPMVPRNWRSGYWFGKITAQPGDDHRVWVQLQGDPTQIDNTEQSAYTLPQAETSQYQGGWLGTIGHTWTPHENVVIDSQAYYQRSRIDVTPILWKNCQEFRDDGTCAHSFVGMQYEGEPVTESWFGAGPNDFNSGEFPYAYFARRTRASAQSSLTLFVDFLGEHELETGVQAEYLLSYDVFPGTVENGEPYYASTGDDPNDLQSYQPQFAYIYQSDWEVTLDGKMYTWYVQDVWKPHPRLTLRPGLRFDQSSLAAPQGTPVFSKLTVAPRFGLAYDLDGKARTSAFFYYGRFYDNGFLIIADILKRASGFGYGRYSWDPTTQDWSTEPDFEVADAFLKGDDLRTPYSDEFNLGLRHGLDRNTVVSSTLIYEESARFWEDDEVNLIWDQEGSEVIGYRNGVNEALYRLRTPDSNFTQYASVELTLQRAFDSGWTLLGSYTWAQAYGTNSSDQATGGLDTPEQRKFEGGYLDYDTRHALKASGNWVKDDVVHAGRANFGFVLGWNAIASSGTPFRPLVYSNYYGGYYNLDRPAEDCRATPLGDKASGPLQPGCYRLPWITQLDVRAGLHGTIDKASWSLGVDMFNLLNTRTITDVNTAYDPDAVGDEQTFGEPLDFQSRRRFQVVARAEF